MGNVLPKESKENIRYTEFEANQVLTADQLNDLFRYLDIQSRLTRTRGIGVGIICGLEIGLTTDNTVVVSKGSAITTDGDLLHFNTDQQFDQFAVFEDINAKYDYFLLSTGAQIPLFELINGKSSKRQGTPIASLAQQTGTNLRDYVGILYQEDYNNDEDVCTGVDCDNKGIECVRELKVLLAHKDQVKELLKSIPVLNKKYFSLEDLDIKRVRIKTDIDKYDELKGAYATALDIGESLKKQLKQAYDVCKPIVEDELEGNDPVDAWGKLLDQHFKQRETVGAQYLYDFCRDLSYAFNEMRETLFNDNALCCPPVELFPKHILLGLLKTAEVKRPLLSPVLTTGTAVLPSRIQLPDLTRRIKFDIGALIRRFNPVHIDTEYRHLFYESPVLNNKDEDAERTRFCFKRIDAMIRNFKIPTAAELKNVNAIKITPSVFEDRKLGERSIPFYYQYNRTLPIHTYWSFDANVRKKEDNLYYYFSEAYGQKKDPLQFNLLPYDFFRIEGHIGFKYQEVEQALNKIILENNLPINLITVQVEKVIRTIPGKNWWFPHLHVYDVFVRNTLLDHINQVDLMHNGLKKEVENDPDVGKISLAMNNFNNVKTRVLGNKTATSGEFDVAKFKKDVGDMISATNEIKATTQKFTFSNTAAPHDFIINTDILHKTETLADLLRDRIEKKKEDLFLGNFMRKNPGLEHAGGVLRGGTFVLVYTSNDDKVVADFMLPYASVDPDVVEKLPEIRPIPLPERPKLEIPKIFEKKPRYEFFLEEKIKPFDVRLSGIDEKFKPLEDKIDLRLKEKFENIDKVVDKVVDARVLGFDNNLAEKVKSFNDKLNGFDRTVEDKIKTIDKAVDDKILKYDSNLKSSLLTGKLNLPDKAIVTPGAAAGGVIVSGKDFNKEAELIQNLAKEIDVLPVTDANRIRKEQQILELGKRITDALNAANATIEKDDAVHIKALIMDIQEATDKVQNTTTLATPAGQPAVNKGILALGVRNSMAGLKNKVKPS